MKDVIYHGKVYRVVEGTLPEFAFRSLTGEEEAEFVAWAKKQPADTTVSPLWHPAVQNELLLSGQGKES